MLGFELVTVDFLAVLEDRVAGMEVHTVLAGDELESQFKICHQFFRRTRLARVVAGGLNAAGESSCVLESCHVVSLPAVHGNGNLREFLYGLLGIYAECGILLFRFCVAHFPLFSCLVQELPWNLLRFKMRFGIMRAVFDTQSGRSAVW